MTGSISRATAEGVQSMKSQVIHDAPRIRTLLPRAPKLELMRDHVDLHVHLSSNYVAIQGAYQVGAIYVALASLLLGRPARLDTVVFSDVTNGSCMVSDWEWTVDMVRFCRFKGVRRAVVGRGTKIGKQARQVASEPPRLEFLEKSHILEALPLCLLLMDD
jgi:hypothetical protein